MSAPAVSARYQHMIGRRFGQLVLSRICETRGDNNRLLGEFACECGRATVYPLARVVNQGSRTHCGCQTDHGTHRTHGMRGSAEYSSWQSMKNRCLDPNNKDFPRWGGRGVTIWPAWISSFEQFYSHIGPRPPGTTLDRIDAEGDYVPGNVRWATASQQQRNKSSSYVWTVKGRQFETCQEAADFYQVSEHTVWRWVRGQFDKRRGTFSEPRSDCHATPRY